MIKKFNEFVNSNISYEIDGDTITFKNNRGKEIGGLIFTAAYYDDILSEYSDSVDDFDTTVMRKFDYNKQIINIEDVWINKEFQGQNLFRKIFETGLDILTKKYQQFILRACSDNGFPEYKLVDIYNDFGFISYQETESDGTIMFLIYKK
jgi:predicted outer membrane repeat protein